MVLHITLQRKLFTQGGCNSVVQFIIFVFQGIAEMWKKKFGFSLSMSLRETPMPTILVWQQLISVFKWNTLYISNYFES